MPLSENVSLRHHNICHPENLFYQITSFMISLLKSLYVIKNTRTIIQPTSHFMQMFNMYLPNHFCYLHGFRLAKITKIPMEERRDEKTFLRLPSSQIQDYVSIYMNNDIDVCVCVFRCFLDVSLKTIDFS